MNSRLLLFLALWACLGLAHGAGPSSDSLLAAAQKTFEQADVMAEEGRSADAKRRFQSTRKILDKLRSQTASSIDVDALRAQTFLMEAAVTVDLGQKAAAKTLFEQAIAAYDDLGRRDPKNPQWKQAGKVARHTLRNIDAFSGKN